MNYSSDSIDEIYTQKTQNGDFQPFIDVMNNVRDVKNHRDDGYHGCHELTMGDRTIAVYIADENPINSITIKNDSNQTYQMKKMGNDVRVYVNDEQVYGKGMDTSSNSKPSASSSGNYSGSSSSKKTHLYDPYDVYDYDDPDDFAEEWAEEFGDGEYEDGYDDAYDYWEEENE